MRIENWSLVIVGQDETQSLTGQVFGHPRFSDGKIVTTSLIVGKNNRNEIITKSGNFYELGRINQAYETNSPNARNRLLNRLKIIFDRTPCI